ncbi:arylsulfatase B [Trichonephila inaurata madagascariensis]|uniref:Arylsulfatase B n=1 Tax=Trichonephila inaurata madagascariensis TaxID=2747483 RepID=A0A8X6YQJ0_9ARAC|nr:arylsulfatase B [Trichonephila inaurata madagascariensis]
MDASAMFLFMATFVLAFLSTNGEEEETKLPPHILFVLVDDLGWNDVSFHGSPQIRTPNIDALAACSLILNNYYTESLCSRARASLMSGNYPIHTGLQSSALKSGDPAGLPLDVMIMPEHLKNKGYKTHIVGKWHLGYSKKDYTPTSRGFDSFFGFYNEQIDYFDYTNYDRSEDPTLPTFYGIDLEDGTETIKTMRGRYATEVFTERALDIISSHNESDPLFLYMAHLAPHTGNEYMPLQAPMTYTSRNSHIQDSKRRMYAGMVSALDESVGKLVDAFSQRGFLENSIIIFASDNGGDAGSYQKGAASNWPLRGQKASSWEGAIRVPSFIWSPLLRLKDSRISTQLMHVSDWLPTLYSAIGGELSDLGKIDGINMWKALLYNLPSPRIELLHNIDIFTGMMALRRGDYKLIVGTNNDASDTWYKPLGFDEMDIPSSMDDWIFKNDSLVKKILEESNLWILQTADSWRINATISCVQPPPEGNGGCDPNQSPCLFNIAADPCEYNNLAEKYPRIVRSMLEILKRYNETAREPILNTRDPQADPRCHGFSYVPWLDEEFTAECPYA